MNRLPFPSLPITAPAPRAGNAAARERRVTEASAMTMRPHSNWRDISDAPRDEYVLVAVLDGDVAEAMQVRWPGGWYWEARGSYLHFRPTHWQPKPAPPSEATR